MMKNIYPYAQSVEYILAKDGKEVFRGTENACWVWLHRNTSLSVHRALTVEGYTMKPVEEVSHG